MQKKHFAAALLFFLLAYPNIPVSVRKSLPFEELSTSCPINDLTPQLSNVPLDIQEKISRIWVPWGDGFSGQRVKVVALLEILREFSQLHNLVFMLYAGTLLGAIRGQGVLPWDDDADVLAEVKMKQTMLDNREWFERRGVHVNIAW